MSIEPVGSQSTWFPRSSRAAQRRKVERLRYTFSHAQAVYDEYRAQRPALASGPPEPQRHVSSPVESAVPIQPAESHVQGPAPLSTEARPADSVAGSVGVPPPASVRPRRRWLMVAAILLAASVGSLGIAHSRRGGGLNALEHAGLDGTAFEGTIQPATTFAVAAPSAMVVRQVLVAIGDRVTAGQPLMTTEDRDAMAGRDAAALDVRAADARIHDVERRLTAIARAPAEQAARAAATLTDAERTISQVPTRQWRDSPTRAQAAYDQAHAHAVRQRKLFEQGLIARQDVEDAEIAVRVAQDDLNNALRAADAGTVLKSAESQQFDAQIELARAQHAQQRIALQGELQQAQVLREQAAQRLAAAEQRIQASTVTATSTGVVIDLPAHAGDQVYAGAPLARLAVLDSMIAEVEVASSLINALKPGGAALVRLPGLPPVDAHGTIAQVNPIPNRNGNHVVAVRFANASGRLLAGQVAEVRFSLP